MEQLYSQILTLRCRLSCFRETSKGEGELIMLKGEGLLGEGVEIFFCI